jgi:hypothetical protein
VGLDFLRDNGARRMRAYGDLPFLLDDGQMLQDQSDETTDHDYERPHDAWDPLDVGGGVGSSPWPLCPVRFVDGKDVGSTVAWLQTREGYPVPVRLSEIGAIVVRNVNGELRREFSRVERVVAMMVDPFPWDEVESFAMALREYGFRLLPCNRPRDGFTFDFERMRKTTQNGSNEEMTRLERLALSQASTEPTIVDGRLEPRVEGFDEANDPVVGLIKTHSENYLHAQGWRTFYKLRPGQRTPAFRVQQRDLTVVTWYVRLDGDQGDMPNWGVVRMEVAAALFEGRLGQDWTHLNRLSALACEYRSRDPSYGRALVSIHPIQRAEESLGSLFTAIDTLMSRFYRLTQL